jgi:pimeloyl-ACP methyl ester carboxylesterase
MTSAPVLADSLSAKLERLPLRQMATPLGRVAYRQAGALRGPPTHVLLHGIGSASASWVEQLTQVQSGARPSLRVLAWDAPGYGLGANGGGSASLTMSSPTAVNYAERLWAWLDALADAETYPVSPVTLVGHSLGCLMAASAACLKPARVKHLVLLSPAQGYARATSAERDQKLKDRLDNLARLGPADMATARGAAMLSANASREQIAFVQQTMAQIDPAGYAQAARMLSAGDLLGDLERLACKIEVASGSADTITPELACRAVAAQVKATYILLPGAGHACAVEAAEAVSSLLGFGDGVAP